MKLVFNTIFLILFDSALGGEKILNGDPVDIEQVPYIVFITFSLGNHRAGFCGGSIINHLYILTAGHCVTQGFDQDLRTIDAQNFTVRAGSANSRRGGERYNVSNVYIRDVYRGRTSHNDIGILKLTRRMYLDGITTRATNLPCSSDYNVPDGTNCYVQGWGVNPNDPGTHHLYRADVSTVNIQHCKKDWSQPIYESHQVCALGKEDADACSGDSGGPLVRTDNNIQIGLVSFGSDCNDPTGQPGVYTRVADNLDWIHEISQSGNEYSSQYESTSELPVTGPGGETSTQQPNTFPVQFVGR